MTVKITDTHKGCTLCKKMKLHSEFGKTNSKSGMTSRCKSCTNKVNSKRQKEVYG